jgi:hypothetical protein
MSSNDIDYFDEGFEDELNNNNYISKHRILTTFEIIELLISLQLQDSKGKK